jgi:hypothetical protein
MLYVGNSGNERMTQRKHYMKRRGYTLVRSDRTFAVVTVPRRPFQMRSEPGCHRIALKLDLEYY